MLHRLEHCLSDKGELAVIAGGVIASSAGEGKMAVDFWPHSTSNYYINYFFHCWVQHGSSLPAWCAGIPQNDVLNC